MTIVATEVFAVAFLVAAFGVVRVVNNRVHDAAHSTAVTALEGLVAQIVNNTDPSRLQPGVSTPVYFQVYYRAGGYASNIDANDDISVNPDPILALKTGGPVRKMPGKGGYIKLKHSIVDTTGHVAAVVEVAASLDNAVRGVDTLKRSLYLATPALIAMVAWLVWLVVGRAFRPVSAIRNEVETISSSTIDRRVPVPDSDDEVARLASTMNAMLDRLEGAQVRQREFVSDASHELRSPIASMRAELEVALAHPEHAEWNVVATRVLRERDRLERLVDDLLQLARLDEGVALRKVVLDLDDIVLAEATHARPVTIATSGVSAGRIVGDAGALEQLVRNLFDNAARHAKQAVSVDLFLDDSTAEVVLRVDDDGAGVPLADRTRIFERFTRSDVGRGRTIGGAGLGLALVQRIVRAHSGTVLCTDAPAGGARFEMRFPAA